MKNVISFILFLSLVSCKAQTGAAAKLSPADFESAIADGKNQVLDVRTAGEFRTGHIKNALQADWTNQQQFTDRVQYMDKSKTVYIYCLVGGRSASAAEWLRKNGFKSVVELQGGINAWKRDNKPLDGADHLEKQITPEEYNASIPKDKTVLVDFGATWCPPCVKMAPVLDELQQDKNLSFQLVKIDGGVHTDLMKTMNIDALPVFIVYKNGTEVWRKQGVVSKEDLAAQLK
ncbi:MAG: thioredoxin fold domain-containing protein [Chitinophagaceae bacterium]|nr:thioredoxin fold domain-containing protein [Chitinophagaceae bacterium]